LLCPGQGWLHLPEVLTTTEDGTGVTGQWSPLFGGGEERYLEMIKAGMAEAYTEDLKDQPYRDQFLQAEKETKAKRLGIWSQGIIYERPSDFRKRMKIRVD